MNYLETVRQIRYPSQESRRELSHSTSREKRCIIISGSPRRSEDLSGLNSDKLANCSTNRSPSGKMKITPNKDMENQIIQSFFKQEEPQKKRYFMFRQKSDEATELKSSKIHVKASPSPIPSNRKVSASTNPEFDGAIIKVPTNSLANTISENFDFVIRKRLDLNEIDELHNIISEKDDQIDRLANEVSELSHQLTLRREDDSYRKLDRENRKLKAIIRELFLQNEDLQQSENHQREYELKREIDLLKNDLELSYAQSNKLKAEIEIQRVNKNKLELAQKEITYWKNQFNSLKLLTDKRREINSHKGSLKNDDACSDLSSSNITSSVDSRLFKKKTDLDDYASLLATEEKLKAYNTERHDGDEANSRHKKEDTFDSDWSEVRQNKLRLDLNIPLSKLEERSNSTMSPTPLKYSLTDRTSYFQEISTRRLLKQSLVNLDDELASLGVGLHYSSVDSRSEEFKIEDEDEMNGLEDVLKTDEDMSFSCDINNSYRK